MAWNGRVNPDPPNPDPNAKSDADQLIEKLTAAIDAKLSPITTKVDSIEQRWAALEEAARKPKEETPPNPKAPTSVLDNEDEAFAQRMGPLAYQNALLGARMTERDIIDEMKEQGWSSLVPDVRKLFDATSIQRKAQSDYPAYCRNCVTLAIGERARTNGFKSNGETFYLENSATSGDQPGNRGLGKDLDWVDSKGRNHTGDEVARKLGIEDVAAFSKEFLQ
jgi:hypothetical protein